MIISGHQYVVRNSSKKLLNILNLISSFYQFFHSPPFVVCYLPPLLHLQGGHMAFFKIWIFLAFLECYNILQTVFVNVTSTSTLKLVLCETCYVQIWPFIFLGSGNPDFFPLLWVSPKPLKRKKIPPPSLLCLSSCLANVVSKVASLTSVSRHKRLKLYIFLLFLTVVKKGYKMKFEKKEKKKNLNFLKMKVSKDKMLSKNVPGKIFQGGKNIIFASKTPMKYYFYLKSP